MGDHILIAAANSNLQDGFVFKIFIALLVLLLSIALFLCWLAAWWAAVKDSRLPPARRTSRPMLFWMAAYLLVFTLLATIRTIWPLH
jgi:hypothetical protein